MQQGLGHGGQQGNHGEGQRNWKGKAVGQHRTFLMSGAYSPGPCRGHSSLSFRYPLHNTPPPPTHTHLYLSPSQISTLGPSHSLSPSLLLPLFIPLHLLPKLLQLPSQPSSSWQCQLHAIARMFFLTTLHCSIITSPKILCDVDLAS